MFDERKKMVKELYLCDSLHISYLVGHHYMISITLNRLSGVWRERGMGGGGVCNVEHNN